MMTGALAPVAEDMSDTQSAAAWNWDTKVGWAMEPTFVISAIIFAVFIQHCSSDRTASRSS